MKTNSIEGPTLEVKVGNKDIGVLQRTNTLKGLRSVRSESRLRALPPCSHDLVPEKSFSLDTLMITQPSIYKFLENGRFQSKFETLSILGKGGFGVVYKAKYQIDNSIYAIKKVKLHLGLNETL